MENSVSYFAHGRFSFNLKKMRKKKKECLSKGIKILRDCSRIAILSKVKSDFLSE